ECIGGNDCERRICRQQIPGDPCGPRYAENKTKTHSQQPHDPTRSFDEYEERNNQEKIVRIMIRLRHQVLFRREEKLPPAQWMPFDARVDRVSQLLLLGFHEFGRFRAHGVEMCLETLLVIRVEVAHALWSKVCDLASDEWINRIVKPDVVLQIPR